MKSFVRELLKIPQGTRCEKVIFSLLSISFTGTATTP